MSEPTLAINPSPTAVLRNTRDMQAPCCTSSPTMDTKQTRKQEMALAPQEIETLLPLKQELTVKRDIPVSEVMTSEVSPITLRPDLNRDQLHLETEIISPTNLRVNSQPNVLLHTQKSDDATMVQGNSKLADDLDFFAQEMGVPSPSCANTTHSPPAPEHTVVVHSDINPLAESESYESKQARQNKLLHLEEMNHEHWQLLEPSSNSKEDSGVEHIESQSTQQAILSNMKYKPVIVVKRLPLGHQFGHDDIEELDEDNESYETDLEDDEEDEDELDDAEQCGFLYEPALVDFASSLPSRAYDKAEEIAHKAEEFAHRAEEIAHRVWEAGWTVLHHNHLPRWLRDNDFLIKGHRPPMNSFRACFKSIFRIHTETGNIWTHLLGCVAFAGVASYFLSRPSIEIQWQDKLVFSAFFLGAILCMGFSWLFHTLYCHSEGVGKFFNKLDYAGIALLTMGSFVPWLYYSFYCRSSPQIVYLVLIIILGTAAIVVSMWDKFSTPKFRSIRAGTFIALGLSGCIPAAHYVITDGFYEAVNFAALGWLLLMAVLYILGAVIYAVRIPERIWPGKFDIWFQSHQIFHVCVVAACFVHFYGVAQCAKYRLTIGDCVDGQYRLFEQ